MCLNSFESLIFFFETVYFINLYFNIKKNFMKNNDRLKYNLRNKINRHFAQIFRLSFGFSVKSNSDMDHAIKDVSEIYFVLLQNF